MFRLVSFRWGNLAALIIAVGEFGLLFTLPLYLQNALGMSALTSGFVLVFLAVGALVAAGAAGPLARRLSAPTVASAGLAVEVAAVALLGVSIGPSTPGWILALILAGYGIGLGLASAQLTSVVLADVPPNESGQGSATQSTARQLGFALGTAIMGTVLGVVVADKSSGVLASVPALTPALRERLESSLGPSAGGIIPQVRDGNLHVPNSSQVADALSSAFAAGTSTTLLIGAGILALGLACTLRLRAATRRP